MFVFNICDFYYLLWTYWNCVTDHMIFIYLDAFLHIIESPSLLYNITIFKYYLYCDLSTVNFWPRQCMYMRLSLIFTQSVFTFIKAYIYIWLSIMNEMLPYTTVSFCYRKVGKILYDVAYIDHKYWHNKQISIYKGISNFRMQAINNKIFKWLLIQV